MANKCQILKPRIMTLNWHFIVTKDKICTYDIILKIYYNSYLCIKANIIKGEKYIIWENSFLLVIF